MKVTIIDYDAGNIRSVENAFKSIGAETLLTDNSREIINSDHIILPGVGSFGKAMESLKKKDLISPIKEAVKNGVPFMGICLGLQLLFESSQESEGVEGLSLLKGQVVKIPNGKNLKVPHVGWNQVKSHGDKRLFKDIEDFSNFYFVHSYYVKAEDIEIVSGVTNYGVDMDVAVSKDNLFGCQFHPEKSGQKGLLLLKNFLEI